MIRGLLLFKLLVFTTLLAFSQAKKPTIMVVPSDAYCINKGFTMVFDDQGSTRTLPDYQSALQQDRDLRLVITKIGEMMADRGFPLKVLEQELKTVNTTNMEEDLMDSKSSGSAIRESPIDQLKRTAKADIILDLDFELKRSGPTKYVVFNLMGLDAYTSKQVASAVGTGEPSYSTQPEVLLEEAVQGRLDDFSSRLQDHFNDLFEKGREVRVRVRVWDSSPVDLEEEYDFQGEDGLELADIIDNWMNDHTVEGRYSYSDGSENFIMFEQVRIPLYDEKGRAVDARRFVRDLARFLDDPPFGLTCKTYPRGLGEAWLIIGEK